MMKNLFLTVAVLLLAFGVSAQTFAEKQYPGDEIANIVTESAIAKNSDAKTTALRTTWVANRPRDNWFISLGGGFNYQLNERYAVNDKFSNLFPTGGIAVGKWFSPVWGLKISASGGKLKGFQPYIDGTWYCGANYSATGYNRPGSYIYGRYYPEIVRERFIDEDGNNPFSYANISGEGMINLKNLVMPYNPKGIFDPVLYTGIAYVHTFGAKFDPFKTTLSKDVGSVNNIGWKSGLQFNFRLADPLQLFLGVETLVVPENFSRYLGDRPYDALVSGTLGLTYRFNFRHFVKAEFYDQSQIDALMKEINDLRNRPAQVCPPTPICPACPDCPEPVQIELEPVFFLIDSHIVRTSEMIKVIRAADYLINNPKTKLTIESYADRETAYPAYNLQLSKKRTDAVAKILTEKLGISADRLILSHRGDIVQPFAENAKNRVTLFIK